MSSSNEFYINLQKIVWTIVIPIAVYLGYINYLPIDSQYAFWLVFGFGLFLIVSASVPIKYPYNPNRKMFFNDITRKWIPREKVLVSRSITRGIGLGFVCYAIGGFVSETWTIFELVGALVGIVVGLKGCIDLWSEPSKYSS